MHDDWEDVLSSATAESCESRIGKLCGARVLAFLGSKGFVLPIIDAIQH